MFWSFVGSWALNLMKLSWLLHIIRNLPLPLFVKCSTCFMPTFVPFFWPAMGKASFSYQIKGKYMSARKNAFDWGFRRAQVQVTFLKQKHDVSRCESPTFCFTQFVRLTRHELLIYMQPIYTNVHCVSLCHSFMNYRFQESNGLFR